MRSNLEPTRVKSGLGALRKTLYNEMKRCFAEISSASQNIKSDPPHCCTQLFFAKPTPKNLVKMFLNLSKDKENRKQITKDKDANHT